MDFGVTFWPHSLPTSCRLFSRAMFISGAVPGPERGPGEQGELPQPGAGAHWPLLFCPVLAPLLLGPAQLEALSWVQPHLAGLDLPVGSQATPPLDQKLHKSKYLPRVWLRRQ